MNKKRVTVAALAGLVLMIVGPAFAQDPDEDIKLFRKDVRSLKKQIIAANIELTDSEAQQFWPIYDEYTAEMAKIWDKKFEVLKEYAKNYSSITDEQADTYIKGRAAVEDSILQLRLKYIPIFRKVLSGKTTALVTQIDWRLGLSHRPATGLASAHGPTLTA